MSDIAVTVTSPGSVNATIGAGGAVSATVSTGGAVAVQLPSGSLAWGDISGKPTEFAPSSHTHKATDITDFESAVQAISGSSYTLPTATDTTLGGVKIGSGITITDGVISADGGGGVSLSDAAPADLGVAAAGVSLEASRADHVHDLPTAADVGALDENSVIDGGDYVGYIPSNVITITQQPADATAVDGKATFSVAATVADGSALTYQWEAETLAGNGDVQFLPISSETSPSLALTGLTVADSGTRYRVVVDSATATAQTSQAATLTVLNAWNISGATASGSYSVATQTTGPVGVAFKPDGLAMYVVGNGGDGVYQYSLSTAWDVTTASFFGSKSVAAQDEFPLGLVFRGDGLRMYVSGSGSSDRFHEYTLSTAWDVTTATLSQSASVATVTGLLAGLFFRADGLKLYVASPFPARVFEYDLTVAWDVSTASLMQSFVAPSSTRGVFFKPDGLAMFTIDDGGQSTATKYTLSTAWDVSTASLDSSVSLSASVNKPFGLFIKPDGLRMYVSGYNSNTLVQFDL